VPEHREVLGGAGDYFAYRSADDLTMKMQALIEDEERIDRYRAAAAERVRDQYGWDAVAGSYETYFRDLLTR
jgi:glycosyltransferase involved in cell wall biosynthesis